MSELISKEDYEEILEWHYRMEKEETRCSCAPPARRTTTGCASRR